MTKQQKEAKRKEITDLFQSLITEFMEFVAQSKNTKDAETNTDAKFKELNAKWHKKCKTRDCRLLQLRNDAFGIAIGLIAKNKVEDFNKYADKKLVANEEDNEVIQLFN